MSIKQSLLNINKRTESFYDSYDTNTMDELLTRDWFMDHDSIVDVLDCADQNAWNYVYDNRSKYSTRIRMLIEPDDYRVPIEKLKIRLGNITDSMMEKMESNQRKKNDELFEKDWVEYSKSVQDRGFSDEDSQLDDAWDNFCRAKDRLTKYLEKPNAKKYVTPNSRGNTYVDPKQAELEEAIRTSENEYDMAQKAVDEVDTLYWGRKKMEYRKKWLSMF